MTEQLKPCPFCGVKLSKAGKGENVHFLHPTDGCVIGGIAIAGRDKIDAWNNRPSPWVPVSERLPDVDFGHFWVHCEGGNQCKAYFIGDRDAAKDYFGYSGAYSRKAQGKNSAHFDVTWSGSYRITHWMPLPAAQKGD